MKIGIVRHFYETDLKAQGEWRRPSMPQRRFESWALSKKRKCAASNMPPSIADTPPRGFAIHEKWLQERPETTHISRGAFMPGAFIRATHYVQAMRHREKMGTRSKVLCALRLCLTASSMQSPVKLTTNPRWNAPIRDNPALLSTSSAIRRWSCQAASTMKGCPFRSNLRGEPSTKPPFIAWDTLMNKPPAGLRSIRPSTPEQRGKNI